MEKKALFIKLKTKSGKRDETYALWEKHLKAQTGGNPDPELYFFCFDDKEPDTICLFEIYSDAAAMERNSKSDAFRAFIKDVMPLLDGWPDFVTASPQWAKGFALRS